MRLETEQPLAESRLWTWQQRFYQRAAQAAWTSGTVPWRITSTPLFAEGLAQVLAGFAKDTERSGLRAPPQPVCVVDLGAGTGRLAALLSPRLSRLGVPHRYVMTDVARANVEAWRRHPALAALARDGTLDFAVADGRSPGPLALLESGETWRPGALPGPLAALAMYLFDTLPHALWRRGGALEEGRVSVDGAAGPDGEPEALADLEWTFGFQPPAAPAPAFVRGYAAAGPEGAFFIPVGAIDCLRSLAGLGGGRLLCLAGDKGPRTLEQLRAAPPPALARHGSVSASVNFHALRAWAGWRPWLEARAPDPAFGVYGVAQGWAARSLEATSAGFAEAFGAGAPLVQERALQALLDTTGAAAAEALLGALAAHHFSPDALVRMAPLLRAQGPAAPPPLVAAAVDALTQVGAQHFELADAPDVPFEIATVLHRLGQLSQAALWYQRSLAARGEHPTTCFNLALCRLDLGEKAAALQLLARVVALAPGHPKALGLLEALG